jgi:Holliday junction resolvasome RuvABC ATP-dependent DNA helicase subunit
VLDDYARNVLLCDLTAQPADIKLLINNTIQEEIAKGKNIPQVGIRLLKFCAEYDLVKISEQVQSYAEPLNARYSL